MSIFNNSSRYFVFEPYIPNISGIGTSKERHGIHQIGQKEKVTTSNKKTGVIGTGATVSNL